MSCLSPKQKFILSDLARQVYAQRPRNIGGPHDGETEEEFRHRHVAHAVGKAGVRACTQHDYKIVEAHFLQLLGRDGAAFNAHVRDAGNPRRIVEYKILEACKHAGVGMAYAETICRCKFKCALTNATVPQLWIIKYDLDRAGKRRRKENQKLC